MKKTISYIIFIFILSSCVSHKNLLMLKGPSKSTIPMPNSPYLIQPGDILSIKVSAMDQESVSIFNKTIPGQTISTMNEAAIYINGYIVDDSGYVNIPLIGNTLVKDLDVSQIHKNIEGKLSTYFKYFSLDIKLLNFRATILGEVTAPGTFIIFNKNTNILQLIGMAGGITDVGNKEKVKIIRKIDNNNSISTYIDISNSDFINSEFYYLKPNDIIYIEPLKAKTIKVNSTGIQVAIGALTFIIVVLNFLKIGS